MHACYLATERHIWLKADLNLKLQICDSGRYFVSVKVLCEIDWYHLHL